MRKFAGFAERNDKAGRIGRELHGYAELLFHYWHRVRDGTLSRTDFRRYMAALRKETEALLERAEKLRVRGVSGACADILEHRAALWAFVDHDRIEPTNNLAERRSPPLRSLAQAVFWLPERSRRTLRRTHHDRHEFPQETEPARLQLPSRCLCQRPRATVAALSAPATRVNGYVCCNALLGSRRGYSLGCAIARCCRWYPKAAIS
jgi:hypothetical protein